MKTSLLFLLLLLSAKIHATEIDGFYVGIRGDTVQCKFDIHTNADGVVNYSLLTEAVKIITENGKKRTLKAGGIRHFYVRGDLNEKFVSLKLHDKYVFLMELDNRKLKLYEHHFRAEDGTHTEMHYVIQSPFKRPSELTPIRFKKQLLRYTNDDPFFAGKFLDKSWKYNKIDQLVASYNDQAAK
ncbi:MAG: hypothetical protein ABJG78_12155 [Cyclobacteriaceae bacterium]